MKTLEQRAKEYSDKPCDQIMQPNQYRQYLRDELCPDDLQRIDYINGFKDCLNEYKRAKEIIDELCEEYATRIDFWGTPYGKKILEIKGILNELP
jgi:hypothetical protein